MIDYNEAKRVFWKKLGDRIDSHGAMDAAILAMCEFVYEAGLRDYGDLAKENAELKEQLKNCKADLLAHLATVFSMEDDPIGRVEANVKNWLWRLAEAERKTNE